MAVLGVAWNGSEAGMQQFVDRHGLTFPNLRDDDGSIFGRFGVPAQPAWAFVSPDGTVTTSLGMLGEDEALDRIDALVGTSNG